MPSLSDQSQSTPPRRGRTASLTFSFIAFAAVLALGYFLTPADAHFRLFHDESSFNRVLSQQDPSNLTVEKIESLLGRGTPIAEQRRLQLVQATRDFCQQTPDSYPDGADADDFFIGYDLGSHISHLQFRNGRIVNFNPREYDNKFKVRAISP